MSDFVVFTWALAPIATLTLANAGTGFTLTATADGLTQTLTSPPSPPINVTAPAPQATQLLVYSQPTAPVPVGSPFNLVIHASTSANALASSYSGTVTLTLATIPQAPSWAAPRPSPRA